MYVVQPTTMPVDYTKNITEGTPTLIDGVYYKSWNQTNATSEEISYRIENQWEQVRVLRNQLLSECDWTQLADIPTETKELWTSYRAQLRDITSQSNPFSINWPVKP
jgi:subtilase family serine protease